MSRNLRNKIKNIIKIKLSWMIMIFQLLDDWMIGFFIFFYVLYWLCYCNDGMVCVIVIVLYRIRNILHP